MRIVYCLNSISYIGGIELVTIAKANALSEVEGYEVFVCVTDHTPGIVTAKLSPRVNLVDLDINYYFDDWKSVFHSVRSRLIKQKRHKKLLIRILNCINPHIVISVGQSEKYIIPKIKGSWKTIREIHYTTDFRILKAGNVIERCIANLHNYYDFKWRSKDYDKIVVLTHEDKERNWKHIEKVTVIPNPLSFVNTVNQAALNNKKIIYIGRLTAQKNLDALIRIYCKILERHPEWTLDVFGEGVEKVTLERLIEKNKLEKKVQLRGVTNNVINELMLSSIAVLTSHFEGFPGVLIEAMECGLPVVSYECPCGPKDIINDGVNGFLVPFGDEDIFAERIFRLIENSDLRKSMGIAARNNSNRFSIDKIIPRWVNLFNKLVE